MCIIEILKYLHEKTNVNTYSPKLRGVAIYSGKEGLASHPQMCLQEYFGFCQALKFISEKEEDDWTIVTYLGIPILSVKLNSGKDFIDANIYAEGKRVTDEGVLINANGNEGFVHAYCSAIIYLRESKITIKDKNISKTLPIDEGISFVKTEYKNTLESIEKYCSEHSWDGVFFNKTYFKRNFRKC